MSLHRSWGESLRTRLMALVAIALVPAGVLLLFLLVDDRRVEPSALVLLAALAALAFTAAWVVSDRYILKPMRALVTATLRLRSGVMSARTNIPRGHGEFTQLARWFDEMAAALEREHAELRRLGRLELYRLLAENSTDLIARVTPQGSILYASPASERLLGYPPEWLVGRFLTGLAHEADVEATRSALEAALDAPSHVTVTHRLRRRDGTFIWMETTLQGVREAGQVTEIVASSRDVTERRRVQAELEEAKRASEEATRMKSEFLANMSHEIRTPMNAVIGMTSLLEDTKLDTEQREFVETIRASGDHLLAVINDILDFSKIESQRLELERHEFDLRGCIDDSFDLVSAAAAQKGIEMACDVRPGVPAVVVGDAGRLRQVLVNLLANAVKFTPEGEVVVTVSSRTLESGEDELAFSVRDTGIGIAPDRVERLFRPFSQVDASTTREYGGSGLGLAISKHLSELMGGRIWVESRLGEGSTFHFTIVAKAALVQSLPNLPEPGLAGRRALIVDDNATNRRILSLQLKRWGILATEASGGEDALALLQRGDVFDIAFLDMRMPRMDGAELAVAARRLRSREELPFVLLSSIPRPRELGADTFEAQLTKPVKPQALHDTLLRVLARGRVEAPAKPSSFDAGMSQRHPLRILLVEDNAVNQKVATRMLERLGYKADVAANGVEALEAIARQRYDVVLMDVQMPVMDGYEATRRLRAGGAAALRVVAMTAHVGPEDRARCEAAGMDDYIGKPIQVEALVAALERARRTPEAKGRAPR